MSSGARRKIKKNKTLNGKTVVATSVFPLSSFLKPPQFDAKSERITAQENVSDAAGIRK